MRFSQGDGGLLDLLDGILPDAGDREVREQVIDVVRRDPLAGNRLNNRRSWSGRNEGVPIWYSGRIRAVYLLAVFGQQGELGLCAIRSTLKCRIQGFQLLAAHFPYLLGIAVMTATSPLPDPLDLALTRCPQPEAAANYLNLLPEYSTRLAALAATMSSQAVGHYRHLASARPEAFTPDLAGSLVNLSIRLATLGRAEDALAAIEEAVALYRHLASARPEAFTPDLAGSLVNLSNRLAALDRAGEGLDAIEEAIRLQRQVGTITDLAGSLINLSNRLAALGRAEDALTAIEEAVTLHRQLAADEPRFTPRLAASLNNLSNRLADLGRAEDSFTAIKEAVALYWRLADAQPDAFTPALAESLNNLSRSLAALGRAEDSLTVIEETVTLYRRLAAARPDAFSTSLARSLTNLSRSLASMGRWEDAQAAAREAAAFYH
jgi:tetratricopeptide (TPR) repeat protein